MLRWLTSRYVWGGILILGGASLLLSNFGILIFAINLFWAAIFLLAGAAFISFYLQNRINWWSLIPAFSLFGLGLSSLFDAIVPSFGAVLDGVLFLGGISAGFFAVYFIQRQQWWAIIPAGILLTLAVVDLLENINLGIDSGAFFFLGIGLTFLALTILPGFYGSLRWAYIPGGILTVMGLVIAAASSQLANLVFPAGLILVGIFFIVWTMVKRNTENEGSD